MQPTYRWHGTPERTGSLFFICELPPIRGDIVYKGTKTARGRLWSLGSAGLSDSAWTDGCFGGLVSTLRPRRTICSGNRGCSCNGLGDKGAEPFGGSVLALTNSVKRPAIDSGAGAGGLAESRHANAKGTYRSNTVRCSTTQLQLLGHLA